jgi:hypothetical protein
LDCVLSLTFSAQCSAARNFRPPSPELHPTVLELVEICCSLLVRIEPVVYGSSRLLNAIETRCFRRPIGRIKQYAPQHLPVLIVYAATHSLSVASQQKRRYPSGCSEPRELRIHRTSPRLRSSR